MFEELKEYLTNREHRDRLWLYYVNGGLRLTGAITRVTEYKDGSLWVQMGHNGDALLITKSEVITKQVNVPHPRMESDVCYVLHNTDCYIFTKKRGEK